MQVGADKTKPARRTGLESKFMKINPELLPRNRSLPFGLYVQSSEAGRVMLTEPGQAMDDALTRKLIRARVEVFILRQDGDHYRALLEERVKTALQSDEIEDGQAAGLAYELSVYAMDEVCREPTPENMAQAGRDIQFTSDLIMERDQLLISLLEMTATEPGYHTHACNVATFALGLIKGLIDRGQKHNHTVLAVAFLFHDLGQVITLSELSSQQEPLTPGQRQELLKHPAAGAEMLREAEMLTPEAEICCMQHHERLDGSGYPLGLKGDQIHLYGRIIAIADVFDALTSDRPFRNRHTPVEAVEMMRRDMAGQFDDQLLALFILMFARGR